MKKSLFILVGIFCYMQLSEAQTSQPFARHYWLNPQGVNYTLSPPTRSGNWIIAAPRNERLSPTSYVPRKNTIAVFWTDNADYAILPKLAGGCSDEVHVIGLRTATGDFDRNVDFEVHSVVQSCNSDIVVLCGSIRMSPTDAPIGMVAVLDSQLNVVDFRYYKDVRVFYSVYAQDGYYFVCGQTQQNTAIVLRDSVARPVYLQNITAFHTLNYPDWAFHKIAVRHQSGQPCSFEFSVSGGRGGMADKLTDIGWAVFQMNMGFLTFSNAAYYFNTGDTFTSRVSIANYPPVTSPPPTTPQGLLLSASTGSSIYTYVFNNNQQWTMNDAFRMLWTGRLEDMDCGGTGIPGNPYQIAWVGNRFGTGQQTADYIRMNTTYPAPATLPTSTPWIYFIPFNASPGYNMYYSLHKVHYGKDGQFHAGGYYSEGTAANANRTTFVVTPELIKADNTCTKIDEIKPDRFKTVTPNPLSIARIYIQGEKLFGVTKRYGFCTMNCDTKRELDCGNQLIDECRTF